MVEEFNMGGKPSLLKQEIALEHNIDDLNNFSNTQVQAIDVVLNKMGKDFQSLKNFFEACKEDSIDTTQFAELLNMFSKNETPEELRRLIDEWWPKVF